LQPANAFSPTPTLFVNVLTRTQPKTLKNMVCTYLRDPPDLHGVAWDIARERYLHNIIQF